MDPKLMPFDCFFNKYSALVLLWLSAMAVPCCKPKTTTPTLVDYYTTKAAPVDIPRAEGWVLDPEIGQDPNTRSGVVMRLVRQSAVLGSPRIEVRWEKPWLDDADATAAKPTVLEEFLMRNLQEMGQLETTKQIRILHVSQEKIQVQNTPAYKVQHEYTLGQQDLNTAISIHQLSLFLVLQGRGLTITAAGRIELFTPLQANIENLLQHVHLHDSFANSPPALSPIGDDNTIDLGRLGGTQHKIQP